MRISLATKPDFLSFSSIDLATSRKIAIEWEGCQKIAAADIMAVPKKKTSNSKRDKRRATWRRKAAGEAQKALSLGKSILTGRAKGFYYPTDDESEEE